MSRVHPPLLNGMGFRITKPITYGQKKSVPNKWNALPSEVGGGFEPPWTVLQTVD